MASRPDGSRLDHGSAAARTEELYREHGRLVRGLCRALLRDSAEGEDAAQRVFLAAHTALLNGTSPREPAAWLATIARNECRARIRARMREPLSTADVDRESSSSDPLADAIRNVDLAAMWSAIAELPRLQRDALLLREFGGLSYEELAGALAVSGSAVESLLFRARQRLRARLETASAGLAGGSWVESLARLAGLGGGMAPVAAKVAAVGVGAAVATGGAVVGPRMLDHARQPQRAVPVHRTSATAPRTPTRSPATARVASLRHVPVRNASLRKAPLRKVPVQQAPAQQVPDRQVSSQPEPVVALTGPAPAPVTASVLPNATSGLRDGGGSDGGRPIAGAHSSSGDGSPRVTGVAHEIESVAAAPNANAHVGLPHDHGAETDSSADGHSAGGHASGGHAPAGHLLPGSLLPGSLLEGHSSEGHSSEGHSSVEDSSDKHSSDGHSSSDRRSSDDSPGTLPPAGVGGTSATSASPVVTVIDPP